MAVTDPLENAGSFVPRLVDDDRRRERLRNAVGSLEASASHRDGTVERRKAILRDARQELLRNHGPGVEIDAVAHRIGSSRRHLQRVFAELSDHCFRETLLAVRMAHARQLLIGTDKPIGTIGRVVGYKEAAQFSKAFRKYHGYSPRGHRQRCADPRSRSTGSRDDAHAMAA